MTVPNETHKLLKIQLKKSNIDTGSMTEEQAKNFNVFLNKISNFYCEQDSARERLINSLRLSSGEMDRLYKEQELNTKKIIFESKMLTLGEMASGVAHEINNPLMILLSSVEILKELSPEEEGSDTFTLLNNIEKSVERIRLIVKGLKTFSRNSENDPLIKSSLQEIIKDTLTLCQEKIKISNTRLEITLPDEPAFVNCRPPQITQVLVNLLNNSRDAVAGNTEKWIKVEINSDDNNYILKVTDSGKGIPLEVQEKLFNPFFTTKPIGQGTGLGLSISKGIIAGHQGHLFVDNNCENTCFVITLPKA